MPLPVNGLIKGRTNYLRLYQGGIRWKMVEIMQGGSDKWGGGGRGVGVLWDIHALSACMRGIRTHTLTHPYTYMHLHTIHVYNNIYTHIHTQAYIRTYTCNRALVYIFAFCHNCWGCSEPLVNRYRRYIIII